MKDVKHSQVGRKQLTKAGSNIGTNTGAQGQTKTMNAE